MSETTVTAPASAASTPVETPAVSAAAPASTPVAAAPVTPPAAVEAKDGKPTPKNGKGEADVEKPAESLLKKPDEKKPEAGLLKPPPEKTKEEADKDASTRDQAKAAAAAEVTVPEGVEVNQELLGELKTLAKDGKLTAQSALDLGLKMQESFVADLQKSLETRQVECESLLRKEWGASFDANVVAAQKVVNKFGDPGLLDALHGLANEPAVMKTLAAIGRAIGEDSIAMPGSRSTVPPPRQQSITGNAAADALANDPNFYPSMRPKEQD